jgi:hypothetical protein
MEINEFVVLDKQDLKSNYKNASVKSIIENPFNAFTYLSMSKMHKFNLIFFIDINGDVFVIKNRYGRNSKEYLESLMKQFEILNKRTINAETFIKNISKKWWRPFYMRKKCKEFIKNIVDMYGDHVR